MSGLFAGTALEQPVTCEKCGKTHAKCDCPRGRDGKVLDPAAQQVRVRREKRRGKMVTVAAGFAQRSDRTDDLATLLGTLKKKFATGGTLGGEKNAPEIELQGDHRDKMVELLRGMGYAVKASGG